MRFIFEKEEKKVYTLDEYMERIKAENDFGLRFNEYLNEHYTPSQLFFLTVEADVNDRASYEMDCIMNLIENDEHLIIFSDFSEAAISSLSFDD